jgi:hypothetical protein
MGDGRKAMYFLLIDLWTFAMSQTGDQENARQ